MPMGMGGMGMHPQGGGPGMGGMGRPNMPQQRQGAGSLAMGMGGGGGGGGMGGERMTPCVGTALAGGILCSTTRAQHIITEKRWKSIVVDDTYVDRYFFRAWDL